MRSVPARRGGAGHDQDIPIWGKTAQLGGQRMFNKGEWGFGVWVPVSFHVIEDFADESNPIVDTDYRFGTSLKLAYGLADDLSLNLKYTPYAHESAHLGDEYTIIALRDPAFERVNVSYEYQQYGVSLTKATHGGESHVTARHGGIFLWGADGYYSDHLLGDPTPTLTPSAHNYEPSFGFEWYLPRGDVAVGDRLTARHWVVSADLRWRLKYDYHQSPAGSDERRPSFSVTLGRALPASGQIGLQQYFVYYYHGVNPYGQLRSQDNYWSAGLGWIFR